MQKVSGVRCMKNTDVNMLSGSITKGLLTISIPVMITNVVQSMFNILDMTILKAYDTDGMAVGAVGACGTLITLISGLVIGIATGANVVVANYIGSNNQKSANRAVGSAILFSGIAGLVLTAIGVSCAGLFLRWANCPDLLLSRAILYFQLYFSGVPLLMIYNFCAAILHSAGDSRRPMIYLLTGSAVKILVSFVLVAIFDKGIVGVAVSTIVSWLVTAVLGITALMRNAGFVQLKLCNLRLYRPELPRVLKIGVPVGFQEELYAFANVAITSVVNTFGPAATTGISISNNFDNIIYQITVAASLAVMPYVSQNIGAGNLKRAMQSVWKGILITTVLGVFFGALSAIFSEQLSSLMSSDPEVIAFSRQKMIIISSTYFINGIHHIFCAALRGMKKPVVPTVSAFFFLFVLRLVWVYFIFPLYPNLSFLYLCWPISWILSIIVLLVAFFRQRKKLAISLSLST